MKKFGVLLLVMIFMAGGVFAMDEGIKVKVGAGEQVKVYVWPMGTGQLLNMDSGTAGVDGIFETKTFFSLSVPLVRVQVMVLDGREKVLDEEVQNYNTNFSLMIDCTGSGCKVVEAVVINETVAEENVSEVVNESVDVNVSLDESGSGFFTGKMISIKDNVSASWVYSVGGGIMLLFMAVFVFMFVRHNKGKGNADEDEGELEKMERKVKETADKIKNVKDGNDRKKKLEAAKEKLAEEEEELKKLEAGDDEKKIEKQEEEVEKAEDDVDEAKK
jgi:hypothetical protein